MDQVDIGPLEPIRKDEACQEPAPDDEQGVERPKGLEVVWKKGGDGRGGAGRDGGGVPGYQRRDTNRGEGATGVGWPYSPLTP